VSGTVQTVGPVTFDWQWWSLRYPELSEWVSPGMAQNYFDIATLYLDNNDGGVPTSAQNDLWWSLGLMGYPSVGIPVQNIKSRQILLGLLTAHIAALNAPLNGNAASTLVGRITSATEGSVSVSVAYPEVAGAEWFNQTRYGAMFWTATKQYRTAQYFPGPGAACGRRWPFGGFR